MDCSCQAPLSMGIPRQDYWSGLLFLPPWDLPDPGIEPMSPALAGDASPLNHQGNDSHSRLDIKPHTFCRLNQAHSCWRFRFHYVF